MSFYAIKHLLNNVENKGFISPCGISSLKQMWKWKERFPSENDGIWNVCKIRFVYALLWPAVIHSRLAPQDSEKKYKFQCHTLGENGPKSPKTFLPISQGDLVSNMNSTSDRKLANEVFTEGEYAVFIQCARMKPAPCIAKQMKHFSIT